jgi:short-subunit dehydrogenase
MGLELAKQLAERGAKVIAVGRNKQAIEDAAVSIKGVRNG